MREVSPETLTSLLWGLGLALAWGFLLWLQWKFAWDPKGKVVLITGGSRGLGLVLARQCVAAGAHVGICARDEHELARAVADLYSRRGSSKIAGYRCDLKHADQVRQTVAQVQEELGAIDLLINNASVIQVGPMESLTLEDYRESMLIHFWGPLWASLEVIPQMRQRRRGRIVNISSIGGKIALPHLLAYTSGKFALAGLSQGMRTELARYGIKVTTVYPGLIRTGSPRNADFKGRHRLEYAWFSISDSLPLLTASAEAAARKIIRSCRLGRAEVIITPAALLAIKFHALFTSLTIQMLTLVNRLLPGPGGIGKRRIKGRYSQSEWSPSVLTRLGDEAARRNNEIPEEQVRKSEEVA